MTINSITPAAPITDPSSKTRVLFGPASVSNNSSTFSVNTQPVYIQAYELGVSDTVTVQIATGSGSGTLFVDYKPLGVAVTLTTDQNAIRLDWPSMYRLVFTGTSVTAIYVVCFEGTMTDQTTYGVAETNTA